MAAQTETSATMKSSTILFSTVVASSLFIATPGLLAQTIDLSSGAVLDSSTAPPAKPASANPKELNAVISSEKKGAEARGSLTFSSADQTISVSGLLEGMEPNKRYQVAVLPAGQKTEKAPESNAAVGNVRATAASTGNPRATPPLAAGTPNAGAPVASAPAAGQPAAGKPKGEERIGPGGAGSSGSSVTGNSGIRPAASGTVSPAPFDRPETAYEVGTFTSDAEGKVEVAATIQNMKLTKAADGIQGRTVIVRNTLDGGESAERTQVASGTISLTKKPTSSGASGQPAVAE